MAEVLPRHFVFGIIIFIGIMSGGVFLINQFSHSQPTFVDDSKYPVITDTLDAANTKLNTQIQTLNNSVSGRPNSEKFGVLGGIIDSVWSTISLLGTNFQFAFAMFNAFWAIFGLPPFFGWIIVSLITAMIGFAVFTLAFYREI